MQVRENLCPMGHRPRERLLRYVLGPANRLEQILDQYAAGVPVTIPSLHALVVIENMTYYAGRVVAISTVVPPVAAEYRLVAALAVTSHPHFGSDTNLWHGRLLFHSVISGDSGTNST